MKCERSIEVLGTVVRVVIDSGDDCVGFDFAFDAAFERAFAECVRIDEVFSRFRQGNELWRLNQNVGRWARVSEELFYLIEVGEKVRIRSGGAFDLGVKEVLEKLGYDRDYSLVEGRFEADGKGEIRERGDGPRLCEIEMRRKDLSVKIPRQIDLGGLGKGYALDKVRGILEGMGLRNFLIDCGGDIYACGESSQNWKVAFENPLNFEEAIGYVFVDGFFLASSSANRRAWGEDEDRRHHLVDMRTLSSAKNVMATYVQCESGILADAWATALFVMGFEEAKEFLESLTVMDNFGMLKNEKNGRKFLECKIDEVGLEAMIISNEGEVFRSPGFRGEIFVV